MMESSRTPRGGETMQCAGYCQAEGCFGPAEFFRLYFRELDARDIPFVILHSYESYPQQIATDVDYAVRTSDLTKLAGLAKDLAESHGWRLAHVIEPHVYARCMVVVDPENPHCFLQLDACGHYVEGGCFLFSDHDLLKDRIRFGDFFVPAPAMEFGYLLAKTLAKGKQIQSSLPRLRRLEEASPAGCEARFRQLLGEIEGDVCEWLKRPAIEWQRLRKPLLRRRRFGLGDKLREVVRATRRTVRPKGLHLALLGFDDKLASKVLDRVGPVIQAPLFRHRRIYRFSSGPAEIDYLEGSSFGSRAAKEPSLLAASANALRLAGSYVALYLAKVVPAKVRNVLVIFAPSPDDLFIAPARHGLKKAAWLGRLLSRILPRADLTIILGAPPKEARESDTGRKELQRRWLAAQELAERDPNCIVVSDQQPLGELTHVVCREVIEFLALREGSVLPKGLADSTA